MTLIGYAESQSAGNQGARYVVRCDCGNYEFRGRILRWFGTEATDMCRECSNRAYKLNSGKFVAAAAPARRAT